MIAEKLRKAVLQAAIQGKLTEQLPEDGDARDLLKEIQQEKARLVKEGKLKKENPLPPITEDEIPFDIPENWVWVRLGEIVSVKGGKRIPLGKRLTKIKTNHKYIRVADMQNGTVLDTDIHYVPDDVYPMIEKYTISVNDIYITVAGTIGRVGTIPKEFDLANLTENADKLVFNFLEKMWLVHLLNSSVGQNQIINSTTKVGQPKLAIKRIEQLLIPLPPRAEQCRILQQIDRILPDIVKLEKDESKLEALQKAFPQQLKNAILQAAIQGKLTEQLPEDGDARDLLKQIQQDKASLVKAGKLKKEPPLPPITEDDIPFDIPDNWVWVRLGELSSYIQRGKSPKYSSIRKYPVIAQKCNQWDGLKIEKAQFIDPSTLSNYDQVRFLLENDLLWNSTGLGTLGRMVIYRKELNPFELAVADSHVTVIRLLDPYVVPEFVFYFIIGPYIQSIVEDISTGTTKQKELGTSTIKSITIPFPPLPEQERMVERLEELLPLCEKLE